MMSDQLAKSLIGYTYSHSQLHHEFFVVLGLGLRLLERDRERLKKKKKKKKKKKELHS